MTADWEGAFYRAALGQGLTEVEAQAFAASHASQLVSRGGNGSETPLFPVSPVSSVVLESQPQKRNNETPETGGEPQPPALFRRLEEAIVLTDSQPEVKSVVPLLVTTGLTLFSGESRFGKSFMGMDMALAVATGGVALDNLVCSHGDVLYISYEERYSALVAKARMLNEGNEESLPMGNLYMTGMEDAYRTSPGAIIQEWQAAAEHPLLVIIDPLTKMKQTMKAPGRQANAVDADASYVAPIHRYAHEHQLAIVIIHHLNQSKWEEAEDWYSKVSGTTGLVATADTNIVTKWKRGEPEAELLVSSRFQKDHTILLRRAGFRWTAQDGIARGKLGDRAGDIADYVFMAPQPVGPAEIAEGLGLDVNQVRSYLSRLMRAGKVQKASRGLYGPPLGTEQP